MHVYIIIDYSIDDPQDVYVVGVYWHILHALEKMSRIIFLNMTDDDGDKIVWEESGKTISNTRYIKRYLHRLKHGDCYETQFHGFKIIKQTVM